MMFDREAAIHFIGGAMGGTAGTAITCPLEVVKTRLQSAKSGFHFQRPSSSSSPDEEGEKGAKTSKHAVNRVNVSPSTSHTTSAYKRILVNTTLFQRATDGRPVGMAVSSSSAGAGLSPHGMMLLRHVQMAARGTTSGGGPEAGVAVRQTRFKIFTYFREIVRQEGVGALYKGLIPNLIGVAPSKAVYFFTYSTLKRFWNESDVLVANSALVHMISAGSAGFVAATAVNPIWLVKTRLQLHHGPMTVGECVRKVYRNEGIRGFYKGVTASYAGISETIIQFVIYEQLRSWLVGVAEAVGDDVEKRNKIDFVRFMCAGGLAKFFACVTAYPHEVVRTRLRESQGPKSLGFFKTLFQLWREGRWSALYRGLTVQLLRTVPNTAITMGTYELVVYALHRL